MHPMACAIAHHIQSDCPLSLSAAVSEPVLALPCELHSGGCSWNVFALLAQREQDPITVFMGVPTMYTYLLNAYDRMRAEEQAAAQAAARRLRLTVCGSSACPLPVMERWKKLSGLLLTWCPPALQRGRAAHMTLALLAPPC